MYKVGVHDDNSTDMAIFKLSESRSLEGGCSLRRDIPGINLMSQTRRPESDVDKVATTRNVERK